MVNGRAASASVVKSGAITLVKYTPSALWPVLSSNYVTLTFTNGTGHIVNLGFTVAYLPALSRRGAVGTLACVGGSSRRAWESLRCAAESQNV